MSLLVFEVDGKTSATSLLLGSIIKNLSIHDGLFYVYPSSTLSIFLKGDFSSHDEDKNGDQNTNYLYGQIYNNVGNQEFLPCVFHQLFELLIY